VPLPRLGSVLQRPPALRERSMASSCVPSTVLIGVQETVHELSTSTTYCSAHPACVPP
jgi:hypothetical protein